MINGNKSGTGGDPSGNFQGGLQKMKKILSIILCLSMLLSFAVVASAAEGTTWTEVSLSDIKSTDLIAITMDVTDDNGTKTYAMTNNNGGSRPSALEVTVSGSSMTSDNTFLAWNITNNSGKLTISPAGSSEVLYWKSSTTACVGTSNTYNAWYVSDTGFLTVDTVEKNKEGVEVETCRNLGVYNSKDWRPYNPTEDGGAHANIVACSNLRFWKTDAITDSRENLPTDSKKIVDAAFALEENEKLSDKYIYEGEITLTGVVVGDATWYDTSSTATVNFTVEGTKGSQTMQAYKLAPGSSVTADDVKGLTAGDTITVSGAVIKNYKGTIEFDGCTLVSVKKAEKEPDPLPALPTDSKEIVDAAFELLPGEKLTHHYTYEGEITLTGVVTEDATWSDKYSNGTVYFTVEGTDGSHTMQAYKLVPGEGLTADDVKGLAKGDTVTISGAVIKNYNGTIEFDGCTLVSVVKNPNADTSNPKDGDSISVFAALLAVSAIGAAVIIKKRDF